MSKTFKVGDVAIIQNMSHFFERNGMEVEIVGGLKMRIAVQVATGVMVNQMMYLVQWPDGEITGQQHHELRPKQPPRRELDEVVSWESVGWMPMDVKLDQAIKQALKDSVKERA